MKSSFAKIALLMLIVGLLSACGTQAAETPASVSLPPTEEVIPATEPPTGPAPSIDTAAPAEPPADSGGPPTQTAVQGATVSFAAEILPIIESRCINCHGGDRTEEGLVLRTHADILAGSDNGPVIVPGDAANSLLVELVTTQKMPKRGPKLTPPQIQLITDWVNQGALDN
jgi:hypothetical protein